MGWAVNLEGIAGCLKVAQNRKRSVLPVGLLVPRTRPGRLGSVAPPSASQPLPHMSPVSPPMSPRLLRGSPWHSPSFLGIVWVGCPLH